LVLTHLFVKVPQPADSEGTVPPVTTSLTTHRYRQTR